MLDETDLSQEKKWWNEERAHLVVSKLQKVNLNAQYVPSCQEALTTVLDMIPEGAVVARADSVTLDQVGIIAELRKRNQNKIIYSGERGADGNRLVGREQAREMSREVFFSDVFLTGTNAVTLDGKLVNIDGNGNRVSAMIFGPDKVIVVVGVNKIVKDVNEALDRIHNVCAPINAKRHELKHHSTRFDDLPCVKLGRCTDCNHDWRICRYTAIIEGAMIGSKGRINVVLVGEELGI